MRTFERKQSVVEAIQFNLLNSEEISYFIERKVELQLESETAYIAGVAPPIYSLKFKVKIHHLDSEGMILKVYPGEWIVKEKDLVYVLNNEQFNKSFDELI